MGKFRSALVLLAATSVMAYAASARAQTIDLVADAGFVPFNFSGVGSTLPTFSFSLSGSGTFTITDAYLSGDQFRINVVTSAGRTVFAGLTSTPGAIGSYTSDPSAALADAAFSHASINLSAGSYTVNGTVAASPYQSGGAFAELVSSISAPGGGGSGSGGAPTPAVNALLGFALAGGTFALLRRRRTGRTLTPVA